MLHGNENNVKVTWKWLKNETELANSESYKIDSNENSTTITISKIKMDDKGKYDCVAENAHGDAKETFELRVKDALAALWPFLAIVAEVIVLCLIILIYEKKCSKKSRTAEDDNGVTENL